jgi:hypothetical protein
MARAVIRLAVARKPPPALRRVMPGTVSRLHGPKGKARPDSPLFGHEAVVIVTPEEHGFARRKAATREWEARPLITPHRVAPREVSR